MEHYDAGTLKEYRWDFTARELLSTMKGVLEGLLCMYNNKIVHRNINPDNILLKYENGVRVAKLCDFGTSRTCG
jgi:serine/threonine protein kinase